MVNWYQNKLLRRALPLHRDNKHFQELRWLWSIRFYFSTSLELLSSCKWIFGIHFILLHAFINLWKIQKDWCSVTAVLMYMWRHIDVQADWRRRLTSGQAPNAIDIRIRWTYSRPNPLGPHGAHKWDIKIFPRLRGSLSSV